MGLLTPSDKHQAPTVVREVRCKDCLRAQERYTQDDGAPTGRDEEYFEYNEIWAQRTLERGGSRSDRCPRHRRSHRQAIRNVAVAYIDLKTIGSVAPHEAPNGPLGGLGQLPDLHRAVPKDPDIPFANFGMTDDYIRQIFRLMANPLKRVLILKAGTGTGKSTFGPYRLLCPPDDLGVNFTFTALGPIIVTEPRVQATIGVATYVGERLVMGCPLRECSNAAHGLFNPKSHVDDSVTPRGPSCLDKNCSRPHVGPHPGEPDDDCVVSDCSRHIGPGYRVGYQVKGDKNHDEACQLVYITDGTMLNWLRDGRLNQIGTVIVDEAHERSPNIDFIMGYLRDAVDRYPHLRVIVTSATFDVSFYQDSFGGPERVETMNVPAKKAFGYGAPLFPAESDDDELSCSCEPDAEGHIHEPPEDYQAWLSQHWPEKDRFGPRFEDGYAEDLWDTTEKLQGLRATSVIRDTRKWQKEMPTRVADQVISLVNSLHEMDIFGDILAFLPSEKTINSAVAQILEAIPPERADVYALLASTEKHRKEAALAARPRVAKRKVVVSTNLAETSLTVSGVRFVVDSGLISQSDWNPQTASGGVPTIPHSQSGVRQRWGRVGRDGPGWVFPLYSRKQFDALPRHTPPGSTRTNLEALIVKAKACGIDRIDDFHWPAAHPTPNADKSTLDSAKVFSDELVRAGAAIASNGAVDMDGHLTQLGKELDQFAGIGSVALAMAVMYADRLACVPEVAAAAYLLEIHNIRGEAKEPLRSLLLQESTWPVAWRAEAGHRHTQLRLGCEDDLDLVLRIAAAWDLADPETRPWEFSAARKRWADSWWLDYDILMKMSTFRHDVLEALSPAMTEAVKRLADVRLTRRTRAVLSRAYRDFLFEPSAEAGVLRDGRALCGRIEPKALRQPAKAVIAMRRRPGKNSEAPASLDNVFHPELWATDVALSPFDLMLRAVDTCSPRSSVDRFDPMPPYLVAWPVGGRVRLGNAHATQVLEDARPMAISPGFAFPGFTVNQPPNINFGGQEQDDRRGEKVIDQDVLESVSNDTTSDEADAAGWPTGNPAPQEDDELLARRRVLDPSDPGALLEVADESDGDGEPIFDALEEWFPAGDTAAGARVRVVRSASHDADSALLCSHYEVGPDGSVTVVCVPDLLAEDVTPADALAAGSAATAGTECEVIAGAWLESSEIDARVLVGRDRRSLFYIAMSDGGAAQANAEVGLIHDLQPGDSIRAQVVLKGVQATLSVASHALKALEDATGLRQPNGTVLYRVPATIAGVDGGNRPQMVVRLARFPHPSYVLPREVSARSTIAAPAQGDEVDLELQYTPGARLELRQSEVDALMPLLAEFISAADDDEGSSAAIKALRPVPPSLFKAMVQARPDPHWRRRVSQWFADSVVIQAHRIARRIQPEEVMSAASYRLDPNLVGEVVAATVVGHTDCGLELSVCEERDGLVPEALLAVSSEYREGAPIRAAILGVDPDDGRFLLALGQASRRKTTLTLDVPRHWVDPIWADRDALEARLRSRLYMRKDGRLDLTPADPLRSDIALDEATRMFRSPAAVLLLAHRLRGQRIRDAVEAAKANPGVTVVRHQSEQRQIVVIADSTESLKVTMAELSAALATAIVAMTVPNRQESLKLSESGFAKSKEFVARAGAWQAFRSADYVHWDITGPTETSCADFITLVQQFIPSITVGEVRLVRGKLTDVGSANDVSVDGDFTFQSYDIAGAADDLPQVLGPQDLVAARYIIHLEPAIHIGSTQMLSADTCEAIRDALKLKSKTMPQPISEKSMRPGRVGWLLDVGTGMDHIDAETEHAAVSRYLAVLATAMERERLSSVQVPVVGQMLPRMLEQVGVARTTKSVAKLFDTHVLASLDLTLDGSRLVLTTVPLPDGTSAPTVTEGGSDGEAATPRPPLKSRRKAPTSGVSGAAMREWLLDIAGIARARADASQPVSERAATDAFLTELAVAMYRDARPLVNMTSIGQSMAAVLEVFGVDRSSTKIADLMNQDLLTRTGLRFATDAKQALQLVGWTASDSPGDVNPERQSARAPSTSGPAIGRYRKSIDTRKFIVELRSDGTLAEWLESDPSHTWMGTWSAGIDGATTWIDITIGQFQARLGADNWNSLHGLEDGGNQINLSFVG